MTSTQDTAPSTVKRPSPIAPDSDPRPGGDGAQRIEFVMQATDFTGPLPPPATLAAYGDAMPGLQERIVGQAELHADRMLSVAEREQEHRFERDKERDRQRARGQLLGFGVAVMAVAGAIAMTALGAPWPGALVGVLPIALVVFQGVLRLAVGDKKAELDTRAEGSEGGKGRP